MQTQKSATPVPSVGIVGGGIAGMTCALRLAKCGFRVTLYEATNELGGNLSSTRAAADVPYGDVYPHMFCDWYVNFWQLFEKDLGLGREGHFARKNTVKLRHKNSPPGEYLDLTSSSSPELIWQSLTSGFKPAMDMYLYGYAMIDIASRRFDQSKLMNNNTITGFLYSQYYSSEKSAELFDLVLREIWSVDGSRASIDSYQRFARHALQISATTAEAMPFAWLLKGSLQQRLIGPFEQALKALQDADGKPLCTIELGKRVLNVHTPDENAKVRLGFSASQADLAGNTRLADNDSVEHDFVVLAVTPTALGELTRSADIGERIVDRVPELTASRRLRSEPIPVVYLHFTRKLPGLPSDLVALTGPRRNPTESRSDAASAAAEEPNIDLTFLDISQLWENEPNMGPGTAVVLAASNFYGLLSENPEEAGYTMIREFFAHLGLAKQGLVLGDAWPSEAELAAQRLADNEDSPSKTERVSRKDGIDWTRTHVRMNTHRKLYVNEVGSSHWVPRTAYPALPNVFFAGDFTEQDHVGMATVEAAVISGMNAAQALRDAAPTPLGAPIEVKRIPGPSRTMLSAMRLALAPSAYLAKTLSLAKEAADQIAHDDYSGVPRAASKIAQLPFVFALDAANATYDLLATLGGPAKSLLARLTKD